MLLDDIIPGRKLGRQLLPRRGKAQRDDAPVFRPGVSLDQALLLQGTDGVANRGPGEAELLGQPADPPKLDVVEEQVDEELGLDRA